MRALVNAFGWFDLYAFFVWKFDSVRKEVGPDRELVGVVGI